MQKCLFYSHFSVEMDKMHHLVLIAFSMDALLPIRYNYNSGEIIVTIIFF